MNIPDARVASDSTIAGKAGNTTVALEKVVGDAITTAIGAKDVSATFSIVGKNASDVMAIHQELRRKGYKVSQSGTNVTLTW